MVEIAQNLFTTRRGSLLMGATAAFLAGLVLIVYLHSYRNSVNSSSAAASVLVAKNLIQKGTPGDIIGRVTSSRSRRFRRVSYRRVRSRTRLRWPAASRSQTSIQGSN